jgi:hypothetical protein
VGEERAEEETCRDHDHLGAFREVRVEGRSDLRKRRTLLRCQSRSGPVITRDEPELFGTRWLGEVREGGVWRRKEIALREQVGTS